MCYPFQIETWNISEEFFFQWTRIVKDTEGYFCYYFQYVKSFKRRFKQFQLHQRWWFFSSLRPLCVFKCVWDISIRNIFQYFFGLVWIWNISWLVNSVLLLLDSWLPLQSTNFQLYHLPTTKQNIRFTEKNQSLAGSNSEKNHTLV